MAVELELSRGEFLVPVLIRAVRAVGVQCGLDLDRLGDAGVAAEAVALSWAGEGDPGDELLRVRITAAEGSLEVAFAFPRPGDAARARRASVVPGSGAALDALATAVVIEAAPEASRLVMSFRP
ncbi:MAG: hypothetical protein JHC74_14995 [Thermoleophilia bacterium]|nr:hypothetical protein [Thermoleophilia bacterium]